TSNLCLPGWAAPRTFGARIAGWPIPPVGGTLSANLSAEHTDWLIDSAEQRLKASLRDSLSEAYTDSTIDTCLSTSPLPKREPQQNEEAQSQLSGVNGEVKPKAKLPIKQVSYDRWMDEADLTPRQRECFSLK